MLTTSGDWVKEMEKDEFKDEMKSWLKEVIKMMKAFHKCDTSWLWSFKFGAPVTFYGEVKCAQKSLNEKQKESTMRRARCRRE